jgi:hypothetical protein
MFFQVRSPDETNGSPLDLLLDDPLLHRLPDPAYRRCADVRRLLPGVPFLERLGLHPIGSIRREPEDIAAIFVPLVSEDIDKTLASDRIECPEKLGAIAVSPSSEQGPHPRTSV